MVFGPQKGILAPSVCARTRMCFQYPQKAEGLLLDQLITKPVSLSLPVEIMQYFQSRPLGLVPSIRRILLSVNRYRTTIVQQRYRDARTR